MGYNVLLLGIYDLMYSITNIYIKQIISILSLKSYIITTLFNIYIILPRDLSSFATYNTAIKQFYTNAFNDLFLQFLKFNFPFPDHVQA